MDAADPALGARPGLVYTSPPTEPRAEIYYLPTTGQLLDPQLTANMRENLLKALKRNSGEVVVLDLGGAVFTPGSLHEFLLPLTRRIQSKELGFSVLVVIAQDPGVAEFVRMLGLTYDIPLYVADSPLTRLAQAEPVGRLTPTEKATIETLAALGGKATVAAFADRLQLQVTAAGNRLINLTRRGYLHREARSRREGDTFIDPRYEAFQRQLQWWCEQGNL